MTKRRSSVAKRSTWSWLAQSAFEQLGIRIDGLRSWLQKVGAIPRRIADKHNLVFGRGSAATHWFPGSHASDRGKCKICAVYQVIFGVYRELNTPKGELEFARVHDRFLRAAENKMRALAAGIEAAQAKYQIQRAGLVASSLARAMGVKEGSLDPAMVSSFVNQEAAPPARLTNLVKLPIRRIRRLRDDVLVDLSQPMAESRWSPENRPPSFVTRAQRTLFEAGFSHTQIRELIKDSGSTKSAADGGDKLVMEQDRVRRRTWALRNRPFASPQDGAPADGRLTNVPSADGTLTNLPSVDKKRALENRARHDDNAPIRPPIRPPVDLSAGSQLPRRKPKLGLSKNPSRPPSRGPASGELSSSVPAQRDRAARSGRKRKMTLKKKGT